MYKISSTEYDRVSFEILSNFMELERIKCVGPLMHGMNGEAEARMFASDPDPRFPYSYGQSDGNHTLETLSLNKIIHLRYNKSISRYYSHDFYVDADFALWQHDYGEYKNGDIADDGTRPKDTDRIEYQILKEDLWDKLTEDTDGEWLESLHKEMLDESTAFGGYCKMLDNFSRVIYCLDRERQGHGGDAKIKEAYFGLSDSDKKAIEYTGSRLTADIFLYSTLEGHPNFFRHNCFPVFIRLIQSAAKSVRGSEIEWLHRYLSTK